jgi:hypothetical protein
MCIRQHAVSIRGACAYVSIRQHTSAYVSMPLSSDLVRGACR